MSILATSTYTPLSGSLHAGVTGQEWTGDLDNVTQYGLLFTPTAAGTYPYILYSRGGTDGANSSLSDAKIQGNAGSITAGHIPFGVCAPAAWDDSSLTPAGPAGYVVNCPDLREGGGPWNGGTAGSGVDELGGGDLKDTLQAWAAGAEMTAKANMSKTCMWGDSRGAINMLGAMAKYGLQPDVCVLRSPLLNIYDWDAMSQTAKASVLAPLDELGFTGADTDTRADLDDTSLRMLKERSPNLFLDELPTTTKYCVVWGEDDTTIPREWVLAFVTGMRARGAEVSYFEIPQFGHSIANSDGTNLAYLHIRRYLVKHLS